MATKRNAVKSKKSVARRPFWERMLEWILGFVKKLLIPALVVWLITWLWLGGIFAKTTEAAWNGFVEWTAAQGMVVDEIILQGRNRTDIADLQNAVKIKIGDPILAFNVTETRNRIEQLNWVDSAAVQRRYNGIITITINERIPFVLWDRPGIGVQVVDGEGQVIEGVRASDHASLLVVRGVEAPTRALTLMRMLMAEPDIAKFVKGAEWVGGRRWDLITTEQTRIYLPEDDIGFALSRLAKAQNDKELLSRDLVSIDLRVEDRIIIESQKGKAPDIMTLSGHSQTNAI